MKKQNCRLNANIFSNYQYNSQIGPELVEQAVDQSGRFRCAGSSFDRESTYFLTLAQYGVVALIC